VASKQIFTLSVGQEPALVEAAAREQARVELPAALALEWVRISAPLEALQSPGSL